MNTLRTVLTFVTFALTSTCVQAGWFGIRNDSGQTILVQQGNRSVRLAPGESSVEQITNSSVRKILVADPRAPQTPILQHTQNCGNEDLTLSIRAIRQANGSLIWQVQRVVVTAAKPK